MEFVRLLLVFLHLLGMGMLVAMFFVQNRAGKDAPLNKGWLHGAALQLLTGVALVGLAPLTDKDYNHVKLGVKLLVVVLIAGLVAVNLNKRKVASWLTPALAGLVVLNVGVAVFWT
ncbi:hypothetical protein ABZ816_20645 [Actinosynnema sp. NPDC047251]|uniref:Uncharacterized protein n=1 Tax=Saccharothrix espanaensis (strain ATCC 51144 / DSM 44229 / JCM 9112 / NBRC 15066 / NRRL 15764) TaxID=1179773 RepID=K0KDW2_SACES|nr:hypothetical protein [Saccharothrix espanaensis]CCH34974.1 hypothetical protein BN6_77540 [Saccharothrix espanaensis DSM 44229]